MRLKNFVIDHREFIIGLILTISLLWPLFAASYFTHHDNVQVIRLYEMDKCFKDGQIPCRWVPDLGGVYGYPLFNYYAPLAYYWGEIFYKIFGSLIISAKVMFATAFVGSYIFMFLLGKKIWGEKGGALSAIFYSFAPYHSVLFYVRGAMGELWGVMFFPAILWSILRLEEHESVTNMLLLALFSAGLLLSHNLSAMIFLPIVLAFAIILTIHRKFNLFNYLKSAFTIFVFLGLMLGLFLGAVYVLPTLVEKNLVHVETTTYGYFSYTEHFKGLKKLFIERMWGWGASVREVPGGEKDGLSFQIGWIHILGWVLALWSFMRIRQTNPQQAKIIIFSTVAILLAVFMINPRSEFVWKAVEPLKYLQFPWRFLGVIIFFISVTLGSVLTVLNKKFVSMVWFGLVILVVALNFSYFRPEKFLPVSDEYYLTGDEWDRQIKRSIFDFLPIYAKAPPAELATSRYEILTGETTVSDFKQGTNWFNFTADTKSHTIIRLSQYYFPNWIIKVDGQQTKVDYENDLGLMTIILGTGTHFVEARLYDTQIRLAANKLSLIAAVLVLVLALLQIQKIRKWLLYYLRRIG